MSFEVKDPLTQYIRALVEHARDWITPAQEVVREHARKAKSKADRDYLETLASSPLVFPTVEMQSRLHDHKVLSAEEEQTWNELFQTVVSG